MERDCDSLTPEEVWCAIDGFIKERLQLKLEKLKEGLHQIEWVD